MIGKFSPKPKQKTGMVKTLKELEDNKHYTRNGILRYENIFGAGFISTGGSDTTLKFRKATPGVL